jgi:orotate phosphoribosyltransferase
MAAIFTYGFDVAEQNFKNANIDLYTLSNYQTFELAVAKSYITEKEEQTLREWSVSPSTWDIK